MAYQYNGSVLRLLGRLRWLLIDDIGPMYICSGSVHMNMIIGGEETKYCRMLQRKHTDILNSHHPNLDLLMVLVFTGSYTGLLHQKTSHILYKNLAQLAFKKRLPLNTFVSTQYKLCSVCTFMSTWLDQERLDQGFQHVSLILIKMCHKEKRGQKVAK